MREGRLPTADGLRLYYRKLGEGAPHVVVPAGLFLERSLSRLAEGRTIVFYDMRNRGRSDTVRDLAKVGIDRDIEDLEAVRAYFGFETMSLIGWSYLGLVTARYAMENPGRVSALVQVGPVPPRSGAPYLQASGRSFESAVDPRRAANLKELLDAGAEEKDPEAFYQEYWKAFKPALFGDTSKIAHYSLPPSSYSNEWVGRLRRHFKALSGSFGTYDLREKASGAALPVLVLHGSADRNAPFEGGREWAESFGNGRLMAFEGAAHLPFVEQPERFFPAVGGFLEGRWPDGSLVHAENPAA